MSNIEPSQEMYEALQERREASQCLRKAKIRKVGLFGWFSLKMAEYDYRVAKKRVLRIYDKEHRRV